MQHPYDRLRVIATPREGMARCGTHDAYERQHVAEMRAKRAAYPALGFRDPWPAAVTQPPFVAGGKWVLPCPCGDAPMASPEWDEARCFACGAVYRQLLWPPDRLAIERVLLGRPRAMLRTWLPGETVADLMTQNGEHGL